MPFNEEKYNKAEIAYAESQGKSLEYRLEYIRQAVGEEDLDDVIHYLQFKKQENDNES